MYSTYIREYDKNVVVLEEQSKKNPAFGAVVREFEVMTAAWPVFSVCGGVSFGPAWLDCLFVCGECVSEFVPVNCVI